MTNGDDECSTVTASLDGSAAQVNRLGPKISGTAQRLCYIHQINYVRNGCAMKIVAVTITIKNRHTQDYYKVSKMSYVALHQSLFNE